jgi:hypothetical protein
LSVGEVFLDRLPRYDVVRVSPVRFDAPIDFSGLFGGKEGLIAFLSQAFPQSLDNLYSLCERKALYSVHEVRTHVSSLDVDDQEDKRIPSRKPFEINL